MTLRHIFPLKNEFPTHFLFACFVNVPYGTEFATSRMRQERPRGGNKCSTRSGKIIRGKKNNIEKKTGPTERQRLIIDFAMRTNGGFL